MSTRQLLEYLTRKINCFSGSGGGVTDYNDLTNLPDLTLKADLVGGKVPASQLPSYVDDVLEFNNLAAFPNPGEQGKLYVTLDTNKIYRWSGSAYIDITPGEADTLQTVINRGNGTNNPIIFQPAQLRAGELNFSPTTYSYWWGNLNTAHTGVYNIGFGYNALSKLTSGNSNISIGSNSGEELTTSNYSTFLGYLSGQKTTTGNLNTFIGDETGNRNTTGFKNTYVGAATGYNTTVGNLNTLIGYKAGLGVLGDRNTFLGTFTGQGVTGTNNVLIGIGAGQLDGAITNKLIIHSNQTLAGYSNTSEGTIGSPQQGQLSRGLITGDFVDRWVRINGYIVVGSPGNSTVDISLIPGQGIKSTVYYAPTLATDYIQKQYVDNSIGTDIKEFFDAFTGTTLTLSNAPKAGTIVNVIENGVTLREGATRDYTISGTTVTLLISRSNVDIEINYTY